MEKPVIGPEQNLPELTIKAILLSVVLAIILAASNAYLGLKVGLIISASIPAAIIAMVAFRFTKNSNILENNLVQTGASASASIASGIVFVTPALLIIRFWQHINYWETVFICIAGGILGVLFSIPLRRALLSNPELKFPEGRAIAEVLKINQGKTNLRDLFIAGGISGFIQLCQQGLQIMTNEYDLWFAAKRAIFGLSLGFDITMIGAGYLVGFNVGLSILLGVLVANIFGVPILTFFTGFTHTTDTASYVAALWQSHIRYIGIGAMLVGGIYSLLKSIKSIKDSLKFSSYKSYNSALGRQLRIRTEYDIPLKYILFGVAIILVMIGWYLFHELMALNLGLSLVADITFFIITLAYITVAGFIFSAITAYFSGLVGVTASPVSAVNLAILILITLLLSGLLAIGATQHATAEVILHAAAISILVTAILSCAGCMSNGTIQDLKTGEILGATPWKLQVILIIGVIVSTLVVPPIIELLFNAYGIGGVFPRSGMNPAQVLGAPQASLVAAITQGIFLHNLPGKLILIGAAMSSVLILVNVILNRFGRSLSVVGFAIGVYLPMSVTTPIIFGSLISLLLALRHHKEESVNPDKQERVSYKVMLIACGLVAGGSLMGLFVSIPFAISGNTNVLSLVPASFAPFAAIISIITTLAVCIWMYYSGVKDK